MKSYLGIEFGSTRIKAVAIGEDFSPLSSGDHVWKSEYKDNVWTYSLDEVNAQLEALINE